MELRASLEKTDPDQKLNLVNKQEALHTFVYVFLDQICQKPEAVQNKVCKICKPVSQQLHLLLKILHLIIHVHL